MAVTEKAFFMIENAYSSRAMGKSTDEAFCKELSSILSNIDFVDGVKTFHAQFALKSEDNQFFGIHVLPDIESFKDTIFHLVDNGAETESLIDFRTDWRNVHDWVIELDPHLLDRDIIIVNPKEFVALLLNEIGHVIYSGSVAECFYNEVRDMNYKLTYEQRSLEKIMTDLFYIPLAMICMQHKWINIDSSFDDTAVLATRYIDLFDDNGITGNYSAHFETIINKIIKTFGSFDATRTTAANRLSNAMEWTYKNISNALNRRNYIKDDLYYMGMITRSKYMQTLAIYMLNGLGSRLRENYTGKVIENTLEIITDKTFTEKYTPIIPVMEAAEFDNRCELAKNAAMEGLFNRRKKLKAVLPSDYEVDAIAIEIDRIENQHDRIFVLDLIYDLLDKIQIFEETIELDPSLSRKWEGKIQKQRDALQGFRKAVLEKKIASKDYKFFVKLPPAAADYEG